MVGKYQVGPQKEEKKKKEILLLLLQVAVAEGIQIYLYT